MKRCSPLMRERIYRRLVESTRLIKAGRFMWTPEIVERVLADADLLESCGFPRLARHVREAAPPHPFAGPPSPPLRRAALAMPVPPTPLRTSVSSTGRNDVA